MWICRSQIPSSWKTIYRKIVYDFKFSKPLFHHLLYSIMIIFVGWIIFIFWVFLLWNFFFDKLLDEIFFIVFRIAKNFLLNIRLEIWEILFSSFLSKIVDEICKSIFVTLYLQIVSIFDSAVHISWLFLAVVLILWAERLVNFL